MRHDLLLRIGVKLILPFILVFALYIHFHADYGPGGGFQAGVIAAAFIIVYALIFGVTAAKRIAPVTVVQRLIPVGVLIYLAAGFPAMFVGKRFLDYSVYGAEPLTGHEWGLLLVETGVIVTVAASMTAIFYALVDRDHA